jgi:1-acyl-sn-glycerol-3-phosphate acyltransferase
MRQFWLAFFRSIFNLVTFTWLGLKVVGAENVPETGAVILASNHASNFDPPLVGTAVRQRLIHFMAKEELFHNPIMNWFLRYMNTFPVHRGHVDRKALVEALRVLKSGEILGIFPEGTRITTGLGAFHEGMAAIAVKSGVPVIPVAVVGSRDLPKHSGPLLVVFGNPIQPIRDRRDKSYVAEFNDEVRQAIAAMLNQYGGDVK